MRSFHAATSAPVWRWSCSAIWTYISCHDRGLADSRPGAVRWSAARASASREPPCRASAIAPILRLEGNARRSGPGDRDGEGLLLDQVAGGGGQATERMDRHLPALPLSATHDPAVEQ